MKFGVVFPQTEIGTNPDDIAAFARAVEEMGYDHILTYDHVLGADTTNRPDWKGVYTSEDMFHEPFVLFSYLAAICKRIEFVTGILILPQRQTALVAKQAACLDILSRGRLRLGIGIGWNAVEYEALGENFRNRGRRSAEQIDVLRRLWAEPIINYEGQWHKITEAGLNPLPRNRTIPIWLGGVAPQVISRVAKLGDGWFPFYNPDIETQIQDMQTQARAYDRDPNSIGIECVVRANQSKQDAIDRIKHCQDIGVTHISVVTMSQGYDTVQEHIDSISRYMNEIVHAV
ncbi:MAG: LLM class F420-dependent oxidoreductase [Gammaproteobacteria bacterium]|nr:LLM class F420-dependent oxidoreductase [Gammaproteobacteria bacterium]MYF38408.1 LLM class F420-dependent oxidoreductase [Gammaproteobacteria bacterium]